MDKDIVAVGILNIIWGVMGLVGVAALCLLMAIPAMILDHSMGFYGHRAVTDGYVAMTVLTIVCGIVAIILFLVCLPSIIGGIGLLRGKNWARILIIVVSFLNLSAFPLGTALGLYGLWALWGKNNLKNPAPAASAPA